MPKLPLRPASFSAASLRRSSSSASPPRSRPAPPPSRSALFRRDALDGKPAPPHQVLQVEIDETDRIQVLIPAQNTEGLATVDQVIATDAHRRRDLLQGELLQFFVVISRHLMHEMQWTASSKLRYQMEFRAGSVPISTAAAAAEAAADSGGVAGGRGGMLCPASARCVRPLQGASQYLLPNGDLCIDLEMMVVVPPDLLHRRIQLWVGVRQPDSLATQTLLQTEVGSADTHAAAECEAALRQFAEAHSHTPFPLESLYSTTHVRVVDALHVSWHSAVMDRSVCWSVRVGNRLAESNLTISRVDLHADASNLDLFVDTEDIPVSLAPGHCHSFLMIARPSGDHLESSSIPSTVSLALTFSTPSLQGPILYQAALSCPFSPPMPFILSLHQCSAATVPVHSTFAVSVSVTNVSDCACDLELLVMCEEAWKARQGDLLAPLLCLETSAKLGVVTAGQCKTTQLHFLALREGFHEIGGLVIRNLETQQQFVQDTPLFTMVTQSGTTS